MYIIDANNLAGQLGLLAGKDFDQQLTGMIREHNREKQKKIILVFDSSDVMGDKLSDGRLTVIYTPRDSFYRNADDKIVEIIRQAQANAQKEEIVVVTDDIAIKNIAEKLGCGLKGATQFAREIREKHEEEISGNAKTGLSEAEEDSINQEMLHKWK